MYLALLFIIKQNGSKGEEKEDEKEKERSLKKKGYRPFKTASEMRVFTPNSFSFQDILRDEGFVYISYFPV